MWKTITGICIVLFFLSCKTPGGVFANRTAHEAYGDKLDKLGLKATVMGGRWFQEAARAISAPLPVQLPYKEAGYFSAERPGASSFGFSTKRGEQLTIGLSRTPTQNYLVFADLFETQNGEIKYIQSLDTITYQLRHTPREDAQFILRIQPELLQSLSYTLEIQTGPSLAFPVAAPGPKNRVISVWGDGRDRGARKHEGIDIGGERGTPLIAVGDGYVNRVTDNNLGGKVVFIRSAANNETWYYAHLDSQIAQTGQRVKTGDIVGLMGNTGNARTTAPHLHFGIYAANGAVDPLPYVNPNRKIAPAISAQTNMLGQQMRISGKSTEALSSPGNTKREKIDLHLPLLVTAATGNFYKATLPGGEIRFVPASKLSSLDDPIKRLNLKTATPLTDTPSAGAPVIKMLEQGSSADLLGIYGTYHYVKAGDDVGWILQ